MTQEQLKTLREALQSAAAAIWDKHYGRGLTEAYARGVHEELQNALAALSRLEAEQPGSSTSEPTHPVCNCEACRLLAEYATPPVECRRFTIRWTGSQYRVSIPNYDGGEVVDASSYDSLREQLKEAAEVMRPFADMPERESIGLGIRRECERAAELVARIEREQKS